ncbi:MAG: D-alanine--D-alanine ligase [Chloroflexota bacterium]
MRGRRAVVISGGRGAEHDVSLASGRAIAEALRDLGADVTTCLVTRDGTWRTNGVPGLGAALEALATADVAFPALHGPWGEDGTVQGLLETVGVPYVGSGVLASATCMDKALAKLRLAAAGIHVAPGRTVRAPLTPDATDALLAEFGLPLFVKPVSSGSSFGVSRVGRAEDLAAAVVRAAAYSDEVLVEPEIRGLEIDLGVLEHPSGRIEAGPLLQIEPDPAEPFFSTAAKYERAGTRFLVPAPVSGALATELSGIAVRAFEALGCRGLARVDFLVDPRRGPIVNEVNTMPGFTEHSQFPQMWRAAGLPFTALVSVLAETAIARRLTSVPA